MQTKWFRFLGMNIKGTPSMRRARVEHDLNVARKNASVLVTQEFKWRWYFRAAKAVLGRATHRWASSPGYGHGTLRPVAGAQSVKWKTKRWRRLRTRRALLHKGVARVSESRSLRAVLLQDRETRLRAWFGTTHFVVGGDEAGDSPLRKRMLRENIEALDKFIEDLKANGNPIFFQLDANIHPGTWAYDEFMAVMRKHKATIHGAHGVEFLFTIDGEDTKVEVRRDWIIPRDQLETDHEGRGVTARLVKREA
jgi:hypothetical protein